METYESHTFLILKIASCPCGCIPRARELPAIQTCPHRVSPGKRGSSVTQQPGRPQLFQQTVPCCPAPRSQRLQAGCLLTPAASAHASGAGGKGDCLSPAPSGLGSGWGRCGGSSQACCAAPRADFMRLEAEAVLHLRAQGKATGCKSHPCSAMAISKESPRVKLN